MRPYWGEYIPQNPNAHVRIELIGGNESDVEVGGQTKKNGRSVRSLADIDSRTIETCLTDDTAAPLELAFAFAVRFLREGVVSATAAERVAAVGAGRTSFARPTVSADRAGDDIGPTVVGTIVEEDEFALEVLLLRLDEVLFVAFVGLSHYLHVASLVDLYAPCRTVLANQRISHLPCRRQLHPACLQVARATYSVTLATRSSQFFSYPSADFIVPSIHEGAAVVSRSFRK